MAVSKRTRFEVLRRDNFTCRYCRSTEGALTIDHVIPVALGGTDDPDNLVAACHDCNAGKGSISAALASALAQRISSSVTSSSSNQAAVALAAERRTVDNASRFKYFCGICWSQVRELQAMAREILAADEGA